MSQKQETKQPSPMKFNNPDGDATYKQYGKLGTLVMEKLTSKNRADITMDDGNTIITTLKQKIGEENNFAMKCPKTTPISYKTLAFIGKLYAQTKKLATIQSVSDEIAKLSN